MRILAAVIVGVVGLALVPACSSGDNSSAGDPAVFAAKYCALYEPCCADAGFPANNQAGCRAFFGALPITNATTAQQCLDDLTAQASDPGFCTFQTTQPDSCAKVYPQNTSTGTAKPGAACNTNDDCAPQSSGDVSCASTGSGTSSVCQVRVHAKSGEACQGTVDGIVTYTSGQVVGTTVPFCFRSDGLYCTGSGTCQSLVDVGGGCGDPGACKDGTFCDGGQCATKHPVGAACTTQSACQDGAYCTDIVGGKCAAKLAEGSACDTDEQCTTGYCDSTSNTCAKPNLGGLGLLFVCQ